MITFTNPTTDLTTPERTHTTVITPTFCLTPPPPSLGPWLWGNMDVGQPMRTPRTGRLPPLPCWLGAITRWVYRSRGPPLPRR